MKPDACELTDIDFHKFAVQRGYNTPFFKMVSKGTSTFSCVTMQVYVQGAAPSQCLWGFDGLLGARAKHGSKSISVGLRWTRTHWYMHGTASSLFQWGVMDSCTLGPKSSRHVQGTAPSLFPWGLDGFLHIGAKFIGARAEHGSNSISGGLRWTPTHWCTPMSVRASINVFP